jgi:hypothetical protein
MNIVSGSSPRTLNPAHICRGIEVEVIELGVVPVILRNCVVRIPVSWQSRLPILCKVSVEPAAIVIVRDITRARVSTMIDTAAAVVDQDRRAAGYHIVRVIAFSRGRPVGWFTWPMTCRFSVGEAVGYRVRLMLTAGLTATPTHDRTEVSQPTDHGEYLRSFPFAVVAALVGVGVMLPSRTAPAGENPAGAVALHGDRLSGSGGAVLVVVGVVAGVQGVAHGFDGVALQA